MSRIGQAPIEIPTGVQVSVTVGRITVNGPKGELQRVLPKDVTVQVADSEVRVTRSKETHEVKALHGLVRSLIANMVQGVTQGYEKALEIHGVGYRAAKQGTGLEIQVGYSHSVKKDAPKGIEFDVPAPTRIVVKGIDKELVGQVAAEIRSIRKPEPYKAKGIRYEGEYVRRKSGKAAKAIGT